MQVINEINKNTLSIRINDSICNRSRDDKLAGYTQLKETRLRPGHLNCHFKETWMVFPHSKEVWPNITHIQKRFSLD